MILIVGVTGVLGRETASQLLAAGHQVRGLTRNPDNAAALKQLGVEVIQGDLIDKASLERACQAWIRFWLVLINSWVLKSTNLQPWTMKVTEH